MVVVLLLLVVVPQPVVPQLVAPLPALVVVDDGEHFEPQLLLGFLLVAWAMKFLSLVINELPVQLKIVLKSSQK